MNSYNQLSKLYLKFQKKRTILTILGVALAAGILFMVLTLYFSNFINERDALRKEADYEMVLFPENETQIAEIVNESWVKSAYKGKYYITASNTYLENALYLNIKNPYKINDYFKKVTKTYEIDGEINEALASYYLQGDSGNSTYIICLMFLFMAVIFAIIGVGIIRNSIQLNTLEQVKDYGILRCIGATQGQLKSIIFLIGFWQELIGLIAGMFLGYIAAFFVGMTKHIKVGVHIVPVAFVTIAFIGDLLFVMSENSKLVKRLTPLEAVRGRLSVKKQKIKARKRGLFGRIFGVEGEYAYKSLMANKGRFFKSVASFGLGIAAFIIISIAFSTVNTAFNMIYDQFGEYELYFFNSINAYQDVDMAKRNLPTYDLLEKLTECEEVGESKAVYAATMYVADIDDYLAHYDDDIVENAYAGEHIMSARYAWESQDDKRIAYATSSIDLYGYSEDEYAAYQSLLVDGTLDVSENGIVIVQNELCYPKNIDDALGMEYYKMSNYQVGDTIDIVDLERFQALYNEKYAEFVSDNPYKVEETEHFSGEVYLDCWQQLIDEGAYKTYTIEGIVQYEKEKMAMSMTMTAIVPLENFCRMTGTSEGESVGVKYKLKKYKLSEETASLILSLMADGNCMTSYIVYDLYTLEMTKKTMGYVVIAIIFIVTMSSINIINTSASNLHLRRQELAQLRVIGVSKNRLIYIVMLEGIITTIVANLLGCALGFGAIIPIRKAVDTIFHTSLQYPTMAAVIGLLFSSAILCGSIYVPIKRMSKDVLEDLNAGGD